MRFVPKMVEKLKELPELRDVATDQEVNGLRAMLVFDRDTASRFGITPSTIDNTLYDAYGQRLVSGDVQAIRSAVLCATSA